ncbi:hypothetical protein EV198_1712 [Roseivirga ehrenbergii]|uniref:Uncharacterized protein n=1 Tax=Roseivirga ehrenbergii (strain DSM 102268 / JCM 13514 / KCTC 12282 / NCIMB 14502 / KMM 6017) TaxID=279360 RepID=A0A150XS41_ROSEK|nr:hypothetical protein [Roseivirga ehrenbergii]KYG81521.1 hypothetical protein MB14_13105 [Roseivirga ehrenbergii]TCL10680.1 hypothetical protein EV198_1712 [Roseivirga ehrenbergii]
MRKLFIALLGVFAMAQITQAQDLPGDLLIPGGSATMNYQTEFRPYFALGVSSMPGAGMIFPLIEMNANATLEDGEFEQLNSYSFSLPEGSGGVLYTGHGEIKISDKQMWIESSDPEIISWFVKIKYTAISGNHEYFLITGNISFSEFINNSGGGPGGPIIMY